MPIRMKNHIKGVFSLFKRLKPSTKVLLLMIALAAAFVFALAFKRIASNEIHHAYNWDSPLYWTVGRGILNGFTPYSDLYENKPLGVFLISAISFRLTDDTIICNIVSFFSVFFISILPAISLWGDRKRINTADAPVIRYFVCIVTVLTVGCLFAVYCEKRAGSFQAEAIGAAFSILFICLVKQQNEMMTVRKRIFLILCSALSICCAVMLKEPFLLVSVFGALLFVDSIKDLFRSIILPCAIGGLLFILILAVSDAFVPYFSVYIKQLFSARLAENTSVFFESLNVLRLFKDIRKISIILLAMILLFIFLFVLRAFRNRKSFALFILSVIKLFASVYIASFCVSIGSFYFTHHFVFAVPVYCAIMIYGAAFLYEYEPHESAPNISVLMLVVLVILAAGMKSRTSYRAYSESYGSLVIKAQYVDELLDRYKAERYQFIGFNDEEKFFGLTKHSPQGPVFVQDPINFTDKNTWFSKSLISQLDQCDMIIVDHYPSFTIRNCVRNIIKEDFTYIPEDQLPVSPPDNLECDIYLRTSEYG